MAWTAPRTWVVGELVTAAIMNTHIRDNQVYLKSQTDLAILEDGTNPFAANQPMAGFLLTGLGPGAAVGNSVRYEQLFPKEFYEPVTFAVAGGVADVLSVYGVIPCGILTNAADYASISWKCPEDFTAIVAAAILVIPRATVANANWDTAARYGAIGENYTIHFEQEVAATYNVTNNVWFAVNVAGILTNLAAGDIGGLQITLVDAAHDMNVIGFYMTYT